MASTMETSWRMRLHCRAPARVCEGLVMVLAAVLYDTSFGVEAFVPPTGLMPSRVLHARSTTPTERASGSRTREACGWATTVALQAEGGNMRRSGGEGGAFYRELGVKRTAQGDEIRRYAKCVPAHKHTRAHTRTHKHTHCAYNHRHYTTQVHSCSHAHNTDESMVPHSAYLKLAKKLHPDVSAGKFASQGARRTSTNMCLKPDPADAAKFKRITAAYEVLSDEEQRYMYDQVRQTSPSKRHMKHALRMPSHIASNACA